MRRHSEPRSVKGLSFANYGTEAATDSVNKVLAIPGRSDTICFVIGHLSVSQVPVCTSLAQRNGQPSTNPHCHFQSFREAISARQ